MKMHDIEKMCHVIRWHRIRVDRSQTLAEHSFMVAALSRLLYMKIVPKNKQKAKDRSNMFEYALFHDFGELFTGDIASPMKDALRKILEGKLDVDPFEYIEDKMFPEGKVFRKKIENTPVKYICKLADLTDAILFIKTEGRGHEKEIVLDRLKNGYQSVLVKAKDKFPELNWMAAEEKLHEALFGVSLVEIL
jgi:5'-deoxynucleotidase YfbR-like HD superfamily hydrolase